jgi:hypothetical protein
MRVKYDVPGSLRHTAMSNCDWPLEQIDSSRFKRRMEGQHSFLAPGGNLTLHHQYGLAIEYRGFRVVSQFMMNVDEVIQG